MRDLYEDLDEKKSKRKKAGSESSKESSLRDWFGRKGAKGKKKGWVDCNAPDGKGGYKSCGRSGKEKRKKYPACRPTPGACKERGKGKSWGKKAKKRKNEEISMDLEQIVREELEAVMNEKEGKKDACYHKVKSRYKVWPSAYASGALVKCRKVGAKNWGNSKKEELDITIENEIIEVLGESHTAADEKTLKRMSKKLRASSELHAGQAKELEDIIDRSPNDELEESHSKKDEKTLEDIADQLKMASKMHAGQADKIDKIVSESNNSKSSNEKSVSEAMNCGCGQDPCKTYGKDNIKIIQFTNEETEKYLEESLYYGLIDEDEELEEAKKKKACKPSKGKKFARRVKGKCVSYGQAGKAKGGGARIKPGTGKGNAYCARSYGDMKSHGKDCSGKDRGTPLCLSRQKWKCSGKYSRKGK